MKFAFPSNETLSQEGGSAGCLVWQQHNAADQWVVSVRAYFSDGGSALLGRFAVLPVAGTQLVALGYFNMPGAKGFSATAETVPPGSPLGHASAAINLDRRPEVISGPAGLFPSPYANLIP